MQGSNSFELKNTVESLQEYSQQKEDDLKGDWNSADDHTGNAKVSHEIKTSDNSVSLKFSLSGQRMWTMEFGKGHSITIEYNKKKKKEEKKNVGITEEVLRSKVFKELYMKNPAFSSGRKLSRYKRNKMFTKGGKVQAESPIWNVAYIYTRKGTYHDIDDPVGTHVGSGLGGKYGLNTEGFSSGMYATKEDTLARNAEPVVGPLFNIEKLERLDGATWKIKNDDKMYKAFGNGIVKDMAKFLEDALK